MKTREDIKKQVQEAIQNVESEGTLLSPKMREMVEAAFLKIETGQEFPREALGISKEMMEKLYSRAYNLFQSGKYEEALRVFSALRKLDPSDMRYSFGIAACYQYKKEYLLAIGNYFVCNHIDPLNPVPYFHLYDCFVKAEHPFAALPAIQYCIALSEKDPYYKSLAERAYLEMNHLENIIKEKLKNS